MERINLTLPRHYKTLFEEIAAEEELSKSELLRHWIKEHSNQKRKE